MGASLGALRGVGDVWVPLGLQMITFWVTAVPLSARGGFLSIHADDAGALRSALLERGVRTDARGSVLRFGPAPYHTDAQLVDAMRMLGEVAR